jgi:streptomycin 6-kinase
VVPDAVRRKAMAVGAEGERWLENLPGVVDALSSRWSIRVGRVLEGGTSGLAAEAVTADGAPAVLKVAIPDGLTGNSPFATELETLLLGDPRCYVRVLRHDVPQRAMLQERLGRPLRALKLPVEAQIDAVASTLPKGWHPVADSSLRTGADQAAFLRDYVTDTWLELGRPCDGVLIEAAVRFARAREGAYDDARAVLIHGDAHPDNVLQSDDGFKLIDPDGMRSEPAHDLGVVLRGWSEELLAADDAIALATSWFVRMALATGVDPAPIWEWAFTERVSSGLFLLQLGIDAGARMLAAAELLMPVDPAQCDWSA